MPRDLKTKVRTRDEKEEIPTQQANAAPEMVRKTTPESLVKRGMNEETTMGEAYMDVHPPTN